MATGRPRRVAVQAAAAGDDRQAALARHAVQRELPAEQLGDRRHRGFGDRHVAEGAEHRDAGGLRVVALRVGADDGLLDPARAAFEDLPVLVDEEVVADVVPPVGVAVVLGDGEHHRGRLVGCVVVGGDGVVHEGQLHHAVVGRRARRHRVGAPRRAGDDRRRRPGLGRGLLLGAGGRARDRRPPRRGRDGDEVHAQRPAQPVRGAQLQLVAATGPHRIGGPLAGARVGRVVAVDGQRHPRAPARAAAAHAHLEATVRRVRAAHAEQVEAPRRAQHPARGTLEIPGADGHAEAACPCRRTPAEGDQRPREQRSQAGGGAEDEGAPTRDRRPTHRGEGSSPCGGRNACTISCHTPRTRRRGPSCGGSEEACA